jgi:hypothetical protein
LRQGIIRAPRLRQGIIRAPRLRKGIIRAPRLRQGITEHLVCVRASLQMVENILLVILFEKD